MKKFMVLLAICLVARTMSDFGYASSDYFISLVFKMFGAVGFMICGMILNEY